MIFYGEEQLRQTSLKADGMRAVTVSYTHLDVYKRQVWIGILGICAAPIALPIALSLICVIAAVIVSVFCVFAGLFLTAVTLAGAAVIGVIGGAALLIQSLPDGLATLGFSLCCGAVGIMSVYGIFCFLKWLLYKVAQLLGKIMKGGKKNEKRCV